MSARRRLLLAFPLLAALALAGCKINSINYFPPHPASVRVLNLIPDSPPLDVSVEGTVQFANLAFQGITGYQSYDNQITNFTVSVPGASNALLNFTVNLSGNQPYSLVLTGSMDAPLGTLLAEFENSGTTGNAQVSVFNGAINQSTVDIYVTAPGADLTNLNPNFFGVGYGGNSRNLTFPGGTYQLRVTPNGAKGILYDSGARNLAPNASVAIVLYSKGSGLLVNAVLLETNGPAFVSESATARIKAVNAASQSGAVNQLFGATPIASNIDYLTASPYNGVPSGMENVVFEAVATPGAPIASVADTLGGATDQSVFVTGLPGAAQAYVLNDLNLPPTSGNARVRYVNTAIGVGAVTIQADGVAQVSALAAPSASGYLQLTAATYTLTFLDAVSGMTVLTLPNVVLTEGQTVTVYMTGTTGNLAAFTTVDN